MSSSPVLLRFSSPVTPTPGPAELRFGHAWSEAQSIYPQGSPAPNNGIPSAFLRRVHLQPFAIEAPAPAGPLIYNLRQFVRTSGYSASSYGSAWMSGGIKIVSLQGLADSHVNAPLVVNTTADQTAAPSGIPSHALASPLVSPRMLYAQGVPTPGLGVPTAQFPPRPTGFESSRYGRPTIEYKTKIVIASAIEADELGFPRVFDPTRKLYPPSALQVGIFGDSRVANRNYVVRPTGADHLEVPIWTSLENTRRSVYPIGSIRGGVFGDSRVANATPSIAPVGWDAVAGLAGVGAGYAVRTLRPAGLYSTPFGLPALAQPPSLAPEGIVGALGEPTVWPRVRWVQASGAAAQAFGDATTWFRLRSVATAGEDAQAHGDTMVSHGRRWLLSEGAQFARAGEPTVSNADRTISPASIYTNFATGHALGWQRALSPVGFNAARFGARIIPETQQAYPRGFAGQHGLATIFNFRKVVIPPSIRTGLQPADRWGAARAWNLRQYISMAYDPDSGLNPQAWAKWTKIENRNRIVGALGGVATRLGDAQVDNAARPLQPIGVPAPAHPEACKSGLVAYRVRHIQTEGVVPPYISRWATAWNSAVLVGPQGLDAPLWGRPAVVNTRRYFNRIGGFDAAWCGYPMVAPRVRTVSIESRYGIAPPYIRAPEVKLHTRYIDAIGYEPAKVGGASLSIHWTIITPRWTLQNLYGSPTVRNVTPELRTRGRASDAFGDAFVRLEWRLVAHAGAMTQLFGRTIIAFRDRTVPVAGIRAGAFGDKLTVEKTGAPPYSTQAITLARFADDGGYIDGFGIPIPGDGSDHDAPEQVSAPTLNQQGAYVRQEDSATRFGIASITANTIRVEPGYWELSVGDPMISLKNRVLKVPAFPKSKIYEPEKPRVSPHTIWAPVGAPSQAIDNHPSPEVLHYVDQIPARGRWKKGIGNPSVALQHRAIQQFFDPETWRLPGCGTPAVQLRRNYITPTGFRAQRMGWHEIPGLRILEQFESEDQADFGAARVEHVVTVGPLLVQQLDALEVGAPQIELLHRVVSAQGYEAMRMGNAKPGDTPYMWQGLRVGPLMPTIPEGVEADLHGEQWISHRVRELHAEGFDDFRSEYQLERFEQRMRVTRRTAHTIPPARQIFAAGVHSAVASGTPDIRPGIHFIRPDGNAEQFRKGAF